MIRPVRTRPCVHLWPERKIESQFSQFPGKSTAQVLVSGIIIKQELVVLDNNLPENCSVLIISLSVLMITNRSVGDVNINTDTVSFRSVYPPIFREKLNKLNQIAFNIWKVPEALWIVMTITI